MVAIDWFPFVFRAIHILSGAAWAGSVFLVAIFLGPAARELGPGAGPMMANLVTKRRMVDVIPVLGGITVLAGLILYWKNWQDSASFGDWIGSTYGTVLTIGGLFGIAALAVGISVTRPTIIRAVQLGGEIAAGGGTPTPEQAAEAQMLRARGKSAANITLALIAIAVFLMSTARVW